VPVFLLNLAAGIGIPPQFRKAAVIVVGILLLIAVLGLGKCAYDRSVIRNHDQKAALKQEKAERKADTNLQTQVTRDDAASQQRQQEITDATRNIPDQAPSARQRAIACTELRREAQQRRKPVPAC
jgi:uncharacterized protein HemX